MQVRLQKFLNEAGVSSRRKAEVLIRAGLIKVNGQVAKIGQKVDSKKDTVTFKGKPVHSAPGKIYIALYKPKKYIVSRHDPQRRKSAFSLLPKEYQNALWNVGRLDFESEGLILFTNDGELTQQLAHPKFEHEKEYEVITSKEPTEEQLTKLRDGVMLPSGFAKPAKVKDSGNKLLITIKEGKKRQIRRMLDRVGLDVQRLIRIRINKLKLPHLAPGQFQFVTKLDLL